MIRRLRTLLLPAALLSACLAGAAEIPWRPYEAARSAAAKNGTLIFVEVGASWCGVCRQMDRTTLRARSVIQALAKVPSVRLDAEKDGRTFSQRHRVGSFPTYLLIDASGSEFGRMNGGTDPAPFVEFLQSSIERHSAFRTMTARVARNRRDAEAFAVLARVNAERGALGAAEPQAKRARELGLRGQVLGDAYYAIGRRHAEAGRAADCLAAMRRAVAEFKEPRRIGLARIGSAAALADLGRIKEAREQLDLLLKVAGMPEGLRSSAERMKRALG
ncbi:MAG: thioredoxin family protein [Fimbriimonadaceae bacterium]|nr:thioredoxin family protein [Fimbriimonadaceae bacterium]